MESNVSQAVAAPVLFIGCETLPSSNQPAPRPAVIASRPTVGRLGFGTLMFAVRGFRTTHVKPDRLESTTFGTLTWKKDYYGSGAATWPISLLSAQIIASRQYRAEQVPCIVDMGEWQTSLPW